MIEPTNQFQFLTMLQQNVGATYTDAELEIVKLLYDRRRGSGAWKRTQLDQASAALATSTSPRRVRHPDCTVPVSRGHGKRRGTGAAGAAGSMTGAAGSKGGGRRGLGRAARPAQLDTAASSGAQADC